LNNLNLIPSNLKYKSAPSVDQKIDLEFNATNKTLLEFDRIRTVNLNTLYDEERQSSTIFRPTFKLSYIYSNKYIGTTTYEPFINNLFLSMT